MRGSSALEVLVPSIFVRLARRGSMARRSLAADLASRPLRVYRSRFAVILDPAAAISVDGEPAEFRHMVRDWPDRDTTGWLTEAIHQRELQRAAQPPVIEVTVTTPPGGIPRADLAWLVQARMAAADSPLQDYLPTQEIPVIRGDLADTQVLPRISDGDTQVIEVRVP